MLVIMMIIIKSMKMMMMMMLMLTWRRQPVRKPFIRRGCESTAFKCLMIIKTTKIMVMIVVLNDQSTKVMMKVMIVPS